MIAMRSPRFWQADAGFLDRALGTLLAPMGAIYAQTTKLRMAWAVGTKVEIPVLCVGNLVAGGAGKTPVAAAISALPSLQNYKPHFLARGYGGRLRGPVRVDPERHRAAEVGDEPLLLAQTQPTWIARDRGAGALAARAGGAGSIIMDDGFQNPHLLRDVNLLVVDGAFGFGNHRPIPAGPLRERLAAGIARADALVIIGADLRGVAVTAQAHVPNLPILKARLAPTSAACAALTGKRVFAFAGIGRPAKFFASLRALDTDLAGVRAFPDHHMYSASEIATLRRQAERSGGLLVTTTKDAVRLPPDVRAVVTIFQVTLAWDDPNAADRLIGALLDEKCPPC